MKYEFNIVVETEEGDFCFDDLKEALEDGMYNVGNYTLKKVIEIKEVEAEEEEEQTL